MIERKPLPTKTRTSFNIPLLLEILKREGEYITDASLEDLLVIRGYINRHKLPFVLNQTRIEGGYVLTLKDRHAPDKAA